MICPNERLLLITLRQCRRLAYVALQGQEHVADPTPDNRIGDRAVRAHRVSGEWHAPAGVLDDLRAGMTEHVARDA